VNIKYAMNELLRRKRRSVVVIFGLALGIGVLVAVNALADAYMGAAEVPLREMGADVSLQRSESETPDVFKGALLPCAQGLITKKEVDSVKNVKGVNQVSTALYLWVFEGEDYTDQGDFAVVTGIELDKDLGPSKANEWIIEGSSLAPEDKGAALADSSYAGQKGLKVGDTISVGGSPLKIVGITRMPQGAQIAASNLYISLEKAQEIADRSEGIPGFNKGDVNQIFLQVDLGTLDKVIADLGMAVPKAEINSAASFIKAIGGIAAESRRFAVLGSLIALLAALIIVAKTVAGNIMERRNEIGIMKTVGWTSKNIGRQFLAETLIQSLIGGLFGLALGSLAAIGLGRLQVTIPLDWGVNPYPHFLMTDTSQKALTVGLPVKISFELFAMALIASVIVGLLSALITLKHINSIKPAEVLRYE